MLVIPHKEGDKQGIRHALIPITHSSDTSKLYRLSLINLILSFGQKEKHCSTDKTPPHMSDMHIKTLSPLTKNWNIIILLDLQKQKQKQNTNKNTNKQKTK